VIYFSIRMAPDDESRRPNQRARASRRGEDDEDEGIDLAQLRDMAGYVARAPRRQPIRFAVWGAIGLALGVAAFHYYPRTYMTEVKILAQKNLVLPALDNPNRAVPREADNPTKDVGTTIMRHDNLIGLIKQVDLLDRWESTRPPALRLKDRLFGAVRGTRTDAERMRAIEGVLEKRLVVTSDDTTITISVQWSDPHVAFEIAQAVEKNFIEAHYDSEVNVINDAIAILQQHAKDEHDKFDVARTEFETAQAKAMEMPVVPVATPRGVRHRVVRMVPHVQRKPSVDPQLLAQLDEKRDAIKKMEDTRNAHIADLSRQLSDALVSLAPAHPAVVALKKRLADAKVVPPALVELRAEERALIDKVASSAPPTSTTTSAFTTTTVATPASTTELARDVLDEDPAVTVARMKLQTTAQKLSDLQSRIDSAKIELDIAKTAHKYRFSIVKPAEVSVRPRKPNPIMLFAGIVFGVLALAFGSVVKNERAKGRLLEEWQLRHRLKLPVIGEIEG
jgi:capsular polysaccharide biosynthesis protein